MPNVFVTADTHFGHHKIIEYCNRPFSSVQEMNDTIIKNWNSVVSEGDHVWHLGDFAFKNHTSYLEQLNGKIHLLLGNHDKFSKTVASEFFEVRDLFHGRLLGDKDSPTFFLFHYPLVSWPKKSYGCIHLYGHVHGRYRRAGELSLDVGVDVHNFTPLKLNTAVELAQVNYGKTACKEEIQQTNSNAADAHTESSSVNVHVPDTWSANKCISLPE